jgi:hypothetical protein
MNANKYKTSRFITFAHLSTHNHFVFIQEPRIFGRHAQVVKLRASSADLDHHLLVAALNSSTALFWLKQACFNKGAGQSQSRAEGQWTGIWAWCHPSFRQRERGRREWSSTSFVPFSGLCVRPE